MVYKLPVKGYVHSTESFGTVDGPGIRYVIFLSGCPMRCLYCHNPDTWEMKSGREMTADEVLAEYDEVKTLIRNGGITATGGEPLLQVEFLTELFQKAKARGIDTCVDTSGITFDEASPDCIEKFDALMEVTDLVLLDIKHIDDAEHEKLTGHSNKRVLNFLDYLAKKEKPVWIRHVVVPGITLNDEYLERLGYEIGDYRNIKALDILPYHDMGKAKYEQLSMDYPLSGTEPATTAQAHHAREVILNGMRRRRGIQRS